MNDRQKIAKAFRELRKLGWFARVNFWCCQSCGCAAVPDEAKNKFVFYHHQDAASFGQDGNIFQHGIYISHGEGGDANEVVAILNKNGLKASWCGDIDKRIRIQHKGAI